MSERTHLPLEDQPLSLDRHGPVFILGCPRSGTTMLADWVASLPGLRQFTGVIVPPRLIHLVAKSPLPFKEELLHGIRDVFWQHFWRSVYFRDFRTIQLLRGHMNLREYLAKPDIEGKIFCYKEPFLAFAATDFATYFTESLFIHIIRDGRDVADSLTRSYPDALSDEVLEDDELTFNKVSEVGFWRQKGTLNIPWWIEEKDLDLFCRTPVFGRYMLLWRHMVSLARGLATVCPERYLELRYEDFVAAPREAAGKISTFVNKPISRTAKRRLKRTYATSVGIAEQGNQGERQRWSVKIAGNLLGELGYTKEAGSC